MAAAAGKWAGWVIPAMAGVSYPMPGSSGFRIRYKDKTVQQANLLHYLPRYQLRFSQIPSILLSLWTIDATNLLHFHKREGLPLFTREKIHALCHEPNLAISPQEA